MGSGCFITGASGTIGSYLMPVPMGFQDASKNGIGLQVSCVQSSRVSMPAPFRLGFVSFCFLFSKKQV